MSRRCCVPDCNYLPGTVRHRFPVYEEDEFNIWVQRIGNQKLRNVDDMSIYKNYFVCDKHFTDFCRSPGTKKLKKYALPTLYVKGFHGEPSPQNSMYNLLKQQTCTDRASVNEDIVTPIRDHALLETLAPTVAAVPIVHDIQRKSPHEPSVFGERLISSCEYKRNLESSDSVSVGKKRKHCLAQVNVYRSLDLTPKAKYMYSAVKKLKRKSEKISKKCLTFKKRLADAEKFAHSKLFEKLAPQMKETTKVFISQFRNHARDPHGYRFSLADKLLALSLFKQSGKGYKLLSKIFVLPSRNSLKSLLKKIPFETGINTKVFQQLARTVSKMNKLDRYCMLVFDEMAISPGLLYNSKDYIDGFEDLGKGQRKAFFADHALVFMVRGLYRKWKQPIAFTLVQGATKTFDLVRLIKTIIKLLINTGLHVMATVCDQGTANVAAINYLTKDTEREYLRQEKEKMFPGFVIEGQEIIPIFDPPHLLKGMRNNLLVKNLLFEDDAKKKIAKWEHILQFYNIDYANGDEYLKMCPKLSDEHVIPNKIKKMKVKCCTQVFSQRVSSVMRKLAQWSMTEERLDPSAEDTADLLLFMDQLFDSVNGSTRVPVKGKMLRCAVTRKSNHFEFWNKALRILKTMKFQCKKTGATSIPPSLKNWILTLENIKLLSEKLLAAGFKYVCLRNMNQDPLENFFGCIRSHGARNINPTSTAFRSAFKSLLITNFLSSHSVNSNCEEDDTDGAIDTLRSFVLEGNPVSSESEEETSCFHTEEAKPLALPLDLETLSSVTPKEFVPSKSLIKEATTTYVSGYVANKVFAVTKSCETCKRNLVSEHILPGHEFIVARRYSAKALCLPNTSYSNMCKHIFFIIQSKLPCHCHQYNLSSILQMYILQEVDFSYLQCTDHDIQMLTVKLIIRLMIHSWTKSVNSILSGKRFLQSVLTDEIKVQALKYFKRHRKNTK